MDEFRTYAVPIALTFGLARTHVVLSLGAGLSPLNDLASAHRDTKLVSGANLEAALDNEWLRRENSILKEDRDIPNKAMQVFAGQKQRSIGS